MQRRQTFALACAVGLPLPMLAQAAAPLLIDGKKTLYQRVITRPGAMLSPKPGTPGKLQSPLNAFYVYQRVNEGGKAWLQVGASADGKIDGFLPEADTVAWRHTMSVAFNAPTGRDRVLFYKSKEGLMGVVGSPKAAELVKKSLAEIKASGAAAPGGAVIAAEPEQVVDFSKQFYLLPVLDFSVALLDSGFKPRILKVASITVQSKAPDKTQDKALDNDVALANFNTGIVFVIDATSSMQPYIDRVRKAMEDVYNQIEAAGIGSRIRFGVIAFQDNPKVTKGMEYLSKMFVDPAKRNSKAEFLAGISSLKATPQSTRAFAEDGYAAVDQALNSVAWNRFGGRYLVYISDASAREPGSPLASPHASTDDLNVLARERGVAIFATHLKTPEGKSDHAIAEEQYRRLAAWQGKTPNYFPIEAGDPARFEADFKAMVTSLVEQVKSPQSLLAPPPAGAAKAPPAGGIKGNMDLVGRAMVLAYLGRTEKTQAPSMYEAWVSDLDVASPKVKALSPRILLTKNQLSDLQKTLVEIVKAAERNQTDPSTFFHELRSAAVVLGRDPSRISQAKTRNLQEAGLMGEYLEGLPYQTEIMSMDLKAFSNLPVTRQDELLKRLRSRIREYAKFHDDNDRWVKLNETASDGELVYPVPTDLLP